MPNIERTGLRYIDMIQYNDFEEYIEVMRKEEYDQSFLKENSIFEIIQRIFKDEGDNLETESFAYRQLIDFYFCEETNTTRYIKADNFINLTKQQYLNKIGHIYNHLTKINLQEDSKVCLLLNSGMSFHSSLLATNIIGATPMAIHSTLSDIAISHALIENKPEVIILDQDTIPKFIRLAKVEENKGFIDKIQMLILDQTNMAVRKRKEWEGLVESIKRAVNASIQIIETNLIDDETPEFKFPEAPLNKKEESDIALVIYTSGTTKNKAKGVLITNKNIVSAIDTYYSTASKLLTRKTRMYLSFLPEAHIFEHIASYVLLLHKYLFAFGNPKTLSCSVTVCESGKPGGDIVVYKPSVMCVVPLVAQRLKNSIESAIKSKGKLISKFYNYSQKAKHNHWTVGTWLGDKILFNAIHKKLGGNLVCIISGGAALEDSLKEWIENVCKTPVLEGYALTETSAVGLLSDPLLSEKRKCFVGIPPGNMKVRINKGTVEEGDGMRKIKGQVYLKGNMVAEKYFNIGNIVDEDGWFSSGDIGQIILPITNNNNENDNNKDNDSDEINLDEKEVLKNIAKEQIAGVIRIISREKELIKLSNGEYYNLTCHEDIYRKVLGIENCMVCIEDHMITPSLLVACEKEYDIEQMKVNIEEIEEQYKVPKPIRIGKVKAVIETWNIENEILTPTMKLRRFKVIERYPEEYKYLVSKD
eukprot:GAHX01000011.1.p1 GENE.GAHX01000011.1~~GAHX01000011.1.p1  ORF type:complete len:702 (-),score=166.92 GAHX01000011.1:542-2647(-)